MEDDIFTRLEKSAFRARFKLSAKDRAYAEQKGPAELRRHAEDFIAKRLAPAVIPNDGRADSDAQSSGLYRAACHRNLLPTVFLQVARRKTGRRIERRATTVCRQPDNGMAPAAN